MGFRCRWIAARRSRDDMLSQLGFAVAEKFEERVVDTGLFAVSPKQGWWLVMGDGWDFLDLLARENAEKLSAGSEAVFFYTDDSAMCCELSVFKHGREVWSFAYDGSEGFSTPKISGTPPELVSKVLAEVTAEQNAQDPTDEYKADYIYDAAPRLGRALVNFRHEESLSKAEYLPIFRLEPAPAQKSLGEKIRDLFSAK